MQVDHGDSISSGAAVTSGRGLTSLARLGVDSGGLLTERANESILALDTALDRLSCFYSLGFRDGELKEGRRKSFDVTLRRRGLQAFHPSTYVLRTEATKRESRLLAAFVDPAAADKGALRALLIPQQGDGKIWKVAIQLRLRPTGVADNSADLGASIVRQDHVQDQFASSIATKSGARSVVLEKSLEIAPGEFTVIAVAQDANRGGIGSRRIDANWPDPGAAAAAITPIAVLQSGAAAILRDGTFVSSGALARDLDELLDPSADTSLASVVCRGPKAKGPLVIERWIEGRAILRFAAITIENAIERCRHTVDVVPGGRLSPGDVDYRVEARIGGEIVAEERRTLRIGSVP